LHNHVVFIFVFSVSEERILKKYGIKTTRGMKNEEKVEKAGEL